MRYNLLLIGLLTILISSCDSKGKADLIENYEKKTSEIITLKDYFENIVPENFKVKIRYKSADVVDLAVYEKLTDSSGNELLFRKWDIDIFDYDEEPQTDYERKYHGKTNSLEIVKDKLSWTDTTFEELYAKLESANCIGISNWKPIEIEYGYNGLGVYSYKVFDQNLDDGEVAKFNDGCQDVFYKKNVVLSYGGGAVGMQCFEDFQQN